MTDIQFLHDLRADLLTVAERTPSNDQPRPRRIPPRWGLLGLGCALAVLAGALIVSGLASSSGGNSRTADRDLLPGQSRRLGLPQVPFGKNPFIYGGRQVSASQAERIFNRTIRFNAGPLVEADSPAANPTNRIHIWIGPFGRRQKIILFEYQSGITVRISPLTPIPFHYTPAQVRSGFQKEVAQDTGHLTRLATIQGLPALITHGNGNTILLRNGSESMDGTTVELFLNHLDIEIFAKHTVPEAVVLATARSLRPLSTIH